jgi:hypothetical protein
MCDAKAEESVSEAQLAALADELPILGELLRARFEGPDLDLDAAKFYAALGPRLEHEMGSLHFDDTQSSLQQRFDLLAENRAGQWRAFTERVMIDTRRNAHLEQSRSIEDIAFAHRRDDVEATLDEVDPDFEHRFYDGVMQRLAAPPKPRAIVFIEYLRSWFQPKPVAFASLALALTVAFLALNLGYFQRALSPTTPSAIAPQLFGEVQVDAIQFEGTVTLSQSNEVTVIWLASAG